MTCIAATRTAIAGERQNTTDGNLKFLSGPKVFRVRDGLYGAAGGAEDCIKFRTWVETDGERPELDDEFQAIRVDSEGIAFLGNELVWIPVHEPCFAIGSGASIALGVLFAQEDNLKMAVAAACKWSDGCGGAIDLLEL